MEIILMGTGTSQGVPMIACECAVCRSTDPRNKRTRTSIHVVMDGLHIQVDAAQEFRQQCVDNGIAWVDLFILTHGHADHVAGLDDMRRFCDLLGGKAIPVYSTDEGLGRIRQIYPYAIRDTPEFRGYPAFRLNNMPLALELPQGTIRSILLPHGRVEVLGLVFEERSTGAKFTYYTDCKRVSPEAVELARGSVALVLDGLRPEPHPTHLCIPEAIEVAAGIGAPVTYLTHLTHTVDHGTMELTLPVGVKLGYDGLKITL
ncbi:MAG TPA: MBL fold metallo-hydrolase [Opitutaceae bacterium]|nr:MBL fold metallo-hydrolase [Opitutaceae bacterium]